MYNVKLFYRNAPVYLTELLHKSVLKRPNIRSADNMGYCFAVPLNKRKTFNDRRFSTVGRTVPTLLNKLPLYIRQTSSMDMFK